MPIRSQTVRVPFADVKGLGGLTKATDVDDGSREVPVNMNFEGQAYLAKDPGVSRPEAQPTGIARRLWRFAKKSGATFDLAMDGAKLRKASGSAYVPIQAEGAAIAGTAATVAPTAGTGTVSTVGTAVTGVGTNFTGQLTANVSLITVGGVARLVTAVASNTACTIEAPFDQDVAAGATFTVGSHVVTGSGTAFDTALQVGQIVRIGPTEVYWVRSIASATSMVVDRCPPATASGLSVFPDAEWTFSATAVPGFAEYLDTLYVGNGVDPLASFDGTRLLFHLNRPRGNILNVYKDRLNVAGVVREPRSVYYSDPAAPTTFQTASVVQPVGTDAVTGLATYYDAQIIFKRRSVWKFAFSYDPIAVAFLPQLDLVEGSFGCAGPRAYVWAENDVWFFTGAEVRALGYKDQQIGVLGVNPAVISEPIKATLARLNQDAVGASVVAYAARRFYLAVPLGTSATNDVVFVCHLLFSRSWTKYRGRVKSDVSDLLAANDRIYSSPNVAGALYLWSESTYSDDGAAYEAYVKFRRYEDADFNRRTAWRYADLQFRALEGTVRADVIAEDFDVRLGKAKSFYVAAEVENEDNALGEVVYGESLVADAFGETVEAAGFIGRRLSFLSKSQSVQLRLSNDKADESFSVCQFAFEGHAQPRRQFSPAKITSIS